MLTLTAQIFDVIPTEKKDRNTGEILKGFAVEAVHKSRGKSEIITLTLDDSTVEHWKKCTGQEFTAEVRPWAVKTDSGVMAGFLLVDKKALPVLLNAKPVLKAA